MTTTLDSYAAGRAGTCHTCRRTYQPGTRIITVLADGFSTTTHAGECPTQTSGEVPPGLMEVIHDAMRDATR